jgi:hypothetical protein
MCRGSESEAKGTGRAEGLGEGLKEDLGVMRGEAQGVGAAGFAESPCRRAFSPSGEMHTM